MLISKGSSKENLIESSLNLGLNIFGVTRKTASTRKIDNLDEIQCNFNIYSRRKSPDLSGYLISLFLIYNEVFSF
jgi:hypothetical protein